MGRKKARFYKETSSHSVDSNSAIILPGEKNSDPTSNPIRKFTEEGEKMSRKKQKALDKYIGKKLQKDEISSLYDRLQKSSVDTASLQSSRTLGTGKCNADEKHFEEIHPSQSDSGDAEEYDAPFPKRNYSPLLVSAEIIEKNPFKATQELLMPSFLESSSDDESSSSDGDQPFERIQVSVMAPSAPTFNVPVERSPEIQDQRMQLPIFAEEQAIMEAIRGNPVVVICGETGSGKTTQVPQFLYEAGFGNKESSNPGIIGVTQPRRVAAVSMADRVGVELNNTAAVGYQIRYDSTTVTSKTAIKFMTDGILLREIQSDFLLTKYSIILLDEAHERNLNTDILVGMLSRIVKLRWKKASEAGSTICPLRLVIMSATLNVEEFSKPTLFNPLPPVLKVEARQHPVTVHFARKTDDDYVTEAYKTVSKIHANLPDGGILVFMSGKREIISLVQRLREKYPTALQQNDNFEAESADGIEADFASDGENEEEERNEDEFEEEEDSGNSDQEDSQFTAGTKTKQPLHVLPLFSLMSPEDQMRIFQDPPAGSRLCVISTNVAETSITIKNIRYVIDSGKVKQRIWDSEARQRYEVIWASKASVAQRTGRAGRTGPGHCYRLYSAAVFENDFPKYSPPEISRMPMEGLVLQLKNMSIDNVERFPLPTEPDAGQIIKAQQNLYHLGILDKVNFKVTEFGRQVALLPLNPSWGAFMVKAINICKSTPTAKKYLPSVAAFVSVMSIGEPFDSESGSTEQNEEKPDEAIKNLSWREFCGRPVVSDLFGALGAFFAYLKQPLKSRTQFCRHHHLVQKRLEEMRQQLSQLLKTIGTQVSDFNFDMQNYPNMCSSEEKMFLRRLISQAFPFQIAEKITLQLPVGDPNHKIASKLPAYRILGPRSEANDSIRFLHPSSYLLKIPPTYLVFTESLTVLDKKTGAPRHYLKNVTAIEPGWIPSSILSSSI